MTETQSVGVVRCASGSAAAAGAERIATKNRDKRRIGFGTMGRTWGWSRYKSCCEPSGCVSNHSWPGGERRPVHQTGTSSQGGRRRSPTFFRTEVWWGVAVSGSGEVVCTSPFIGCTTSPPGARIRRGRYIRRQAGLCLTAPTRRKRSKAAGDRPLDMKHRCGNPGMGGLYIVTVTDEHVSSTVINQNMFLEAWGSGVMRSGNRDAPARVDDQDPVHASCDYSGSAS